MILGRLSVSEGVFRLKDVLNVDVFDVKEGDLVIERGKHSCNVKFVEAIDEECILLVSGVRDEVFMKPEFPLFYQKYQLLCKKEDRQDLR